MRFSLLLVPVIGALWVIFHFIISSADRYLRRKAQSFPTSMEKQYWLEKVDERLTNAFFWLLVPELAIFGWLFVWAWNNAPK